MLQPGEQVAARPGRWERSSAEQPIGLFDADGRPIRLEPGSTWIELAEAIPTDDIGLPDADVVIRG